MVENDNNNVGQSLARARPTGERNTVAFRLTTPVRRNPIGMDEGVVVDSRSRDVRNRSRVPTTVRQSPGYLSDSNLSQTRDHLGIECEVYRPTTFDLRPGGVPPSNQKIAARPAFR